MSITSTLTEIDITKISLDEKNPRTTTFYETHEEDMDHESSQKTLKQIIKTMPGHKELETQIIELKAIIVPVLINKENDKLIVFDGNNRCCVALRLYMQALENNNAEEAEKWKMVHARIYENLSLAEIDRIRSQVHTGGVKEWGPYATARDLKRQVDEHPDNERTKRDIAVDAKKSVSELDTIIQAYNTMLNKYLPAIQVDDPDTEAWYKPYQKKFSYFVEFHEPAIEAVVKNKCKQLYGNDKDYIDVFCKWVKDKKITAGEHVRHLPDIFITTKANRKFFEPEGNTKEAMKYINSPDLEGVEIDTLTRAMKQKVLNMNTDEIKEFQSYEECIDMINSVITKLNSFKTIQDALEDN